MSENQENNSNIESTASVENTTVNNPVQNTQYQQPNYQQTNIPKYSPEYKPLSPWAYFGYNLLFSIPLAGFIMLIVFSFDNSNINRRNYARSFFCTLLISIVIILVVIIIISLLGFAVFNTKSISPSNTFSL